MINIKMDHIGDRYYIGLVGHAMYDKVGKDIVCASVSTLIQSFIFLCDDLEDEEKCVIEKREIREGFTLFIVEDSCEMLAMAYRMLKCGLVSIADTYKNFVTIE